MKFTVLDWGLKTIQLAFPNSTLTAEGKQMTREPRKQNLVSFQEGSGTLHFSSKNTTQILPTIIVTELN